MIYVQINADDYGYDDNRTSAISEAFKRKIVSTTTAMANREYFPQAMLLAKSLGFLDCVGLHFNLTEGVPLTGRIRECRRFCTDSGDFGGDCHFHMSTSTRLHLSAAESELIAEEAKAQLEMFLDNGGKLMHLDSHHHVHTDFSVARVLLPLAKNYGFKTTRMSRTIPRNVSMAKRIYKIAFNRYASGILPFCVDEFTDFRDFRSCYRALPSECRVEVMVHPEYKDGSLVDAGVSMQEQEVFWNSISDCTNIMRGLK